MKARISPSGKRFDVQTVPVVQALTYLDADQNLPTEAKRFSQFTLDAGVYATAPRTLTLVPSAKQKIGDMAIINVSGVLALPVTVAGVDSRILRDTAGGAEQFLVFVFTSDGWAFSYGSTVAGAA